MQKYFYVKKYITVGIYKPDSSYGDKLLLDLKQNKFTMVSLLKFMRNI